MNKVKIMLSTIAVFAVVGGALAFKAKTYSDFYCTRPNNGPSTICVQTGFIGTVQAGTEIKYRTTSNPLVCNGLTNCATLGTRVLEP